MYLGSQASNLLRHLPGTTAGFCSKEASVCRFCNKSDAVTRRGARTCAFLVVGVDVNVGEHLIEDALCRIHDPIRNLPTHTPPSTAVDRLKLVELPSIGRGTHYHSNLKST